MLTRHRDPAVQGHRRLVGDEGPPVAHPGAPRLLERPRLGRVHLLDIDTRSSQALRPTRSLGIRVARAEHDPLDTGGQNRVGARRRRALVRARLERGVERRPARVFARRVEHHPLGVAAAHLRDAFGDHCTVSHEDSADRRLRICLVPRGPRKLDRPGKGHDSG